LNGSTIPHATLFLKALKWLIMLYMVNPSLKINWKIMNVLFLFFKKEIKILYFNSLERRLFILKRRSLFNYYDENFNQQSF